MTSQGGAAGARTLADTRGLVRVSSISDLARMSPGWKVTPTVSGPRDGSIRKWRGRHLTFAHYSGGGVAFIRNDNAADEFDNQLQIAITHTGLSSVTRGNATTVSEPGTVATMRMDRAYECVLDPRTTVSLITVPLEWLESRGVSTKNFDGFYWRAGVLEDAMLQIARHAFDVTSQQTIALESALLELIVGILRNQTLLPSEGLQAQARARVIAIIDEKYMDPDLDPLAIAQRIGVSRRYLYGLFEGRDVSIAALVRQRRVTHAQQLLAARPDMSLRQVANLCGLRTEDRLLRTFRAVVGMSPSTFRRKAQTG